MLPCSETVNTYLGGEGSCSAGKHHFENAVLEFWQSALFFCCFFVYIVKMELMRMIFIFFN